MIRNTITQMTAGLLAVSFMLIPAIPVSAEAGPGAAGSGRPPVQQEAGIPYRQEAFAARPAAAAYGDAGSQRAIQQNSTLSDGFLAGITSFSYKTASAVLKDSQVNQCYSPVSLYYSLALAAQAAGGSTRNQLYGLLTSPGQDASRMAAECGSLYRLMYRDNEASMIKPVSSMWLNDGSPLDANLRRMIEQQYHSDVFRMDLTHANSAAVMNRWLMGHGNQGISPGLVLSQDETMHMLDTMCYSSQWVFHFDSSKNISGQFHPADGQAVTCEYMTDSRNCSYYHGQGFMRAVISLKENSTLILVLPDEGFTPQALLSSEERMAEMFGHIINEPYGRITLNIPKFQYGTCLELRPILEDLGVSQVFTPGQADFSGLADSPACLSGISQASGIRMDENGINAASCLVIPPLDSSLPGEASGEMILNRPFIYAVMAAPGVPALIGVCGNPSI